MTTMQTLQYLGTRHVEWREAPAPGLLADTDVLVRPVASSFCDLDRRIAHGSTPFEGPFALGHEAAGVVAEVGDAAARQGLRPGDRVAIPFYVSCGQCDRCVTGRPLNCRRTPWLASYGNPIGGAWGGCFDDLVRVPWGATSLVPLPDDLPWELAAAVGDNLTDAYVGVGPYLSTHRDASVLILGGTPSLGLLIVMFAVRVGTGPVTYLDDDPLRCQLARRLGATHVLEQPLPHRVPGDYDLVIEARGNAKQAPAVALRSVQPGGRCHFRCVYFDDVALPYLDMSAHGVTIEMGLPQIQMHAPRVAKLLTDYARTPSDVAGPLEVMRPFRERDEALEVVLDKRPGKPVYVRE